jgi:hypothetical protein
MGHEIELRKDDLEHLSDIRTVNDWIVGILKADILSEEFIKPSVRIQCCASRVKLWMNIRVSVAWFILGTVTLTSSNHFKAESLSSAIVEGDVVLLW